MERYRERHFRHGGLPETNKKPMTLKALETLVIKLNELEELGKTVMKEGGRGVYSPRRSERHLRIGNRLR